MVGELDLYKVVYPEQVKAATALMQQAEALFQIAYFTATMGDTTNSAVQAEVREKANKLQELGTASEWLLGPEIKALCCQLANGSRLIYTHRNEEQQNQFEADWLSTEPTNGGNGNTMLCTHR